MRKVILKRIASVGRGVGPSSHRRTTKEDALHDDRAEIVAEVSRLGETLRIRTLAACEPVLEHFGLEAPVELINAAVLVDPASTTHLVRALIADGWVIDQSQGRTSILPPTRATLWHPLRARGLDVYYLLPGFLADPEVTFDVLWERRANLTFDSVNVPSLNRGANVLTVALYGAGKIPGVPRVASGYDFVLAQLATGFTPADIEDLIAVIEKLHGTTAMRGLLVAWGRKSPADVLIPESYAKWRLKVDAASPVVRAMVAVLEAPIPQRWELARMSQRALGSMPGPGEFIRALRVVLNAKSRLRDYSPSDPRGSGWADDALSR